MVGPIKMTSMILTRRSALTGIGLAGLSFTSFGPALARGERVRAAGNPIIPGRGVCDPQVRVWDGEAWLYATHDADPAAKDFVMRDCPPSAPMAQI